MPLQFNISRETKGRDEFDGTTAADTGVTMVYLGPQFSATWGDKLIAVLGVGLPVLRDNTAFQIVPDYRIQASVSWQF